MTLVGQTSHGFVQGTTGDLKYVVNFDAMNQLVPARLSGETQYRKVAMITELLAALTWRGKVELAFFFFLWSSLEKCGGDSLVVVRLEEHDKREYP